MKVRGGKGSLGEPWVQKIRERGRRRGTEIRGCGRVETEGRGWKRERGVGTDIKGKGTERSEGKG